MNSDQRLFRRSLFTFITAVLITLPAAVLAQTAAARQPRPMNFMDVLELRSAGSPAISPDGRQVLYTLSVPDWKAAKSFTDIWLVSTGQGAASARQMTFTKDKNETSPQWSRDGKFFVFASNREAPAATATINQLYLMRPDGGEARRITDAKNGVSAFAFSKDGRWLAFTAGQDEEQQIWIIPVVEIETATPQQLTKHSAPVTSWQFSPDSTRIYFLSPASFNRDNKERLEKKFDVRIRNEETPLVHLWAIDLATQKEARLTSGDFSVNQFSLSKDSKWIGFTASPKDRYKRNITDQSDYADVYLMEAATGKIERLTSNEDIAESVPSFSPDSSMMAFAAADDFQFFHNTRLYVRAVSDSGGKFKKLGSDFDGDLNVSFWSADGRTIYSNAGVGATMQLLAISVTTGKTTQLTREKATLMVTQDDDTRRLLINYSDPVTPPNLFTVASPDQLANRAAWKQLTDSNPQTRQLALGATEAIQWKSTDGKMVEGILVRPVSYQPGKRYPLIVMIHGGPQSADTLRFTASSGYYPQVFAGAGYACLMPNYRGSTNYGETFKMQIGGDYFRQGYEDIMAGVDYLIAQGIADGDKMGVMGWSAGGHWSNWILTHTDRFKAISTGAGAMNWISMYAQTDTQRVREFYYGGKPPYDDFDKYWNVSPLKYIKNAKTPTLIHVVDGDPRVPRPQSEELHMALKKLGVPTEFFVYPGTTHGITEPRNQLVKMVAEFNWFEKWIRGKDRWFEWKELLDTLKEEKPEAARTQAADKTREP
jgi:dipeptidyl aminopeptidase/acylaminoacyl peptidase